MANRENVINELNECIEHIRKNKFNKIPFWGNCQGAMMDASELLKQQEPIEPKQTRELFGSMLRWWYACGNCGLEIRDGENKWQYCPQCGKPVKWK